MTAFFIFDSTETLIIERIYFDVLTMLKQLLGGLDLKNPANWLRALRVFRGLMRMSGKPDQRLLETTPPNVGVKQQESTSF
jgi:hypothetical protein